MKMRKQFLAVTIGVLLVLSVFSVLQFWQIKPAQATEIFNNGFEAGDFTSWTSNSTSGSSILNVTNNLAEAGSYSCYMYCPSESDTGILDKDYSGTTTNYNRFYFYLANYSFSAGNYIYPFTLHGSGGWSPIYYLGFQDSTAKLRLYYNNNSDVKTTVTSATTVSKSTWHCLETMFNRSNTGTTYNVWLDGTNVTDLAITAPTGSIGAPDYWQLNTNSARSYSGNFSMYLDRVIFDSFYIGTGSPSDTTAPTFTVQSVNTTTASASCLFSCLVSDNVAVNSSIFGTNNTGHWVNETVMSISGPSAYVNYTKTLNDTAGNIVQYEWWGNDTSNNWGNSGIQSLTISSGTHTLTINSLPVAVTYTVNGTVSGASVNAASGSAADIQTAINSIVATGGVGTVYVPAGTYDFYVLGQTWTPIYIPDGVNLVGADPNTADSTIKVGVSHATLGVPSSWNTILNMPYEAGGTIDNPKKWFTIGNGSSNPNLSCRFANIKLQGYRTTNPASVSLSLGIEIYGVINFRVDHCMFENIAKGAVNIPCWYQQNMYCSGIIDHCNITNLVGYDDLVNYENSNIGYGISISRAYNPDAGFSQPMPFDQPMTMLGQYTNHTIFIENNYFSLWRHCVSSGHSGYYVFRYNWINKDDAHYSLDVHGLRDAEAGRSGAQGVEVYENNFTASTDWYGVMQDGGGYGVFFNNVIDSTYQFVTLYNEDAVSSTTWHIMNFYMWGNAGTWTPYITYPTGSISSDRNVTADWTRPAGSYGGASYPNVSSSWSITGYTPYLYPMPLTVSSLYSGSTNASISLTANSYSVNVPSQVSVGGYTYNFAHWQDASTNNTIIITLTTDTTLTATYTESTAVIVTIVSPTNSTQTSSTISVSLSATGGTIQYYWWNCKNGTSWIYTENQSYPGHAFMYGVVNGTQYTGYFWANNTDGTIGVATVMFSVQILTDVGGTTSLIVNVWWSGWW